MTRTRPRGRAGAGRPAGRRARLGSLLPGVILLLACLVVARPLLLVGRVLLLLPAILPGIPVDPLTALTPAPRLEQLHGTYPAGRITLDVYQPADGQRHGGLLFLLGALPLPLDDPQLTRAMTAMARDGIVVAIPATTGLDAGRVAPAEMQAIEWSWQRLRSTADVRANRTGIIGLSVGGGLALAAAEQPPVQTEARVVGVVGAYASLPEVLVDIASNTQVLGGRVQPWSPAPVARTVFERTLRALVPADEQPALASTTPAADPTVEAVRELLHGGSREQIQGALDRLPPAFQAQMRELSPVFHLGELRAPVYVLHDVSDVYIPVSQAEELRAATPPGVTLQVTTSTIFQHVLPDRPAAFLTVVHDDLALVGALYHVVDGVTR